MIAADLKGGKGSEKMDPFWVPASAVRCGSLVGAMGQ
jgi:hypothetical protein